MVAQWWSCKVPTEVYSLEKMDDDQSDVFVDIWNMWPLQKGKYDRDVFDSKQTHSVLGEVVGSRLRLLYPVDCLSRSYQLQRSRCTAGITPST